jgi:surface antigen
MFVCAAIAAARPLSFTVSVRASFSDRGGPPAVKVSIRSVAGARCHLTAGVGKRGVSFPAMIADARGLLVVSWQVPAGAPSGLWSFDVSCARGQQVGQGGDHVAIRLRGETGTGRLVANSSSQVIWGDLAARRARARVDSYASSCSAEACFADDPLWQAAGESTWYAVGRRPDLGRIVSASAGDWLKQARGRAPEGTTPVPGAIAVWLPNTGEASSAGHVAYVAGVSGTQVLVDDSNWGEPALRVHRHLVPAIWISGYIYGGPAGGGPSASVSAPPPAVSTPSLSTASVPPGLITPPGESGPGGPAAPPEEGLPGGPGPSQPVEEPSKPVEEPGGSGAGPPIDATLPPPPTAPTPESLTSILPQAQQIMAQPGTVWSKAAAVRNLVRASLGDQNACGIMATAFWSVGSIVGLPLRLVDSSANGQNHFDTHATVEVWLAGLGHWAISDPTFNGYWTAGPSGPPVGVEFLQRAMRAGTNNTLYWHGAGTPNSLLPSQYYVDPTYLYADTEFLTFVPGWGQDFMVASQAEAFFLPQVFVPTTGTDFESLPPNAQTPVTVDERAGAPPSTGVSGFTPPPTYIDELVYQGQLTAGSSGRISLPVTNPGPATVVAVETDVGNWQIEVGGVTTYELAPYPGAQVSPMLFLAPPVYLIPSEAISGPVTVRIWTVKDFPASREVTSQWEGT